MKMKAVSSAALLAGLSLAALAPAIAADLPDPATDPAAISPLPPELQLQTGALEVMPYPVLVPHRLPQGFALADVRLHHLPHAREGMPRSYSLVFAAGKQSFMLQSSLPGYHPNGSCGSAVLLRSQPLFLPGYSWEPQTLSLISPACSVTGTSLGGEPLSPAAAEAVWRSLRWYLPLAFRQNPPRWLPQ